MIDIKQWGDIADKYSDSLLLGNGASMAINSCFSYRSLKEAAAAGGLIPENIKKVFDHFDTEDFEFVMAMIWHANHVNVALGLPESLTTQAYLRSPAGAGRGRSRQACSRSGGKAMLPGNRHLHEAV